MVTTRISKDKDSLKKGKVNLLYGPRRVGKTELIRKLISSLPGKTYRGEGDAYENSELHLVNRDTYMEFVSL